MELAGVEIQEGKSPFTFDVYCCPRCRYVVSVDTLKTSRLNLPCGGCGQTTLRDYKMWPGTAPEEV